MRTLLTALAVMMAANQLTGQSVSSSARTFTAAPGGPVTIESFVQEGFEDSRFPPAGWALEYNGTLFWSQFQGASAYGMGTGSTTFSFYGAPEGTTQSLVLSSMGPSVQGDSLRFDHAHAAYPTLTDQLTIETSTDRGTTYSELVSLYGGASGPLATAPPQKLPFVPTATQWATKRYALPVGTNRIRFKAVSAWGNNLYLDNVGVGGQASLDAGILSIDIANPTLALPQVPAVMVKNNGTTSQSFPVTLQIFPGGYTSTKNVTALARGAMSQVTFDEWTPVAGTNTAIAFTSMGADMDLSNDTLRTSITAKAGQKVTNISAFFRDGQVFITWDNVLLLNVRYSVFKSSARITSGLQLSSAQNLGSVGASSALNQRLTELADGIPRYLRIDSAATPLEAMKGLFVATSSEPGSFYYAVTVDLGGVRDTAISLGSNSLGASVDESVAMPQPVWQERRNVDGRTFDIYAQFATKVTSPQYPQMTNLGSYPFHFAIVKFGTQSPHPLTFWMHGSPPVGSLLPTNYDWRVIGDTNEWVITIDDWTPSALEGNCTLYYGYHENYDMRAASNPVPSSGILHNYTSARVAHTVDWALKYLPVDTTRTYMTGWSMGAIGTVFSALRIPSKIAALFIYGPVFDLTNAPIFADFEDRLWGSAESNLLTNEGYTRNHRLSVAYLMGAHRDNSFPIVFTFCGKKDWNVGWGEKIPVYDVMNTAHLGGHHFWSWADHQQIFTYDPWKPTFPNFSFFTRYRTNLSYPAFSNCSINDNPGNGDAADGASVGSINGHLDWNDNIVDSTARWEITLRLKDLATTSGADIAPDSATTDVTLRRLQAFHAPRHSMVAWENKRRGLVVQQGSFAYDSGLVTIPAVKVYKDSSRLVVSWYITGAVADGFTVPSRYLLEQNYPNPFNPATMISYHLPVANNVRLVVHDLLGREVVVLVNGKKDPGKYEVKFDGTGLSSGVYVYRLQAGDFVQSKKLIILK